MRKALNTRTVNRISRERKYAKDVFFGARDALYSPAFKISDDEAKNMPIAMYQAISQELYRIARKARDMARKAAPVQSGALRAGIYVTAPASRSDVKAIGDGVRVKIEDMLGTTSGYYRAINAAAKKRDQSVPGEGDAEYLGGSIQPRTQRPYGKKDKLPGQIAELTALGVEDPASITDLSSIYKDVAKALPFNPMGSANKLNFFIGLGSAMYYSAWIEYGNSKIKGRPFFTPAADWMINESNKAIPRIMKKFAPAKKPAGRPRVIK